MQSLLEWACDFTSIAFVKNRFSGSAGLDLPSGLDPGLLPIGNYELLPKHWPKNRRQVGRETRRIVYNVRESIRSEFSRRLNRLAV
jgi:hypothetical protein